MYYASAILSFLQTASVTLYGFQLLLLMQGYVMCKWSYLPLQQIVST